MHRAGNAAAEPPALPQDRPGWHRYLRFWRSDPGADIAEELRFHLESAIDEQVRAGMTPDQARVEAMRRFGDVPAVSATLHQLTLQRERTMQWTDRARAFRDDLRIALRHLRKNPTFAIVAVFTLALGIGVNSAMFSVVDAVLFRPLPYGDPGRLVMIAEGLPALGARSFGTITAADYLDFQTLSPRTFTATAAFQGATATLLRPDGAERVNGVHASSSLLRVLGVRPAMGRGFTPDADAPGSPDVAIVSDGLWRRDFGADPAIIGKRITLDGHPTTVVGVMPARVAFPVSGLPVAPADFITPLRITPAIVQDRGNGYNTYVLARLAPGVEVQGAQAAVSTLAQQLSSLHPEVYGQGNRVVADVVTLRDRLTVNVRQSLLVLMAAVVMVLLIACLNVSGLLLARAATREREIAVRGALGASRGRLAQQFVAESLVLVAAGAAVGLLAAQWGTRLLAASAPSDSLAGYDVTVNARVIVATLLVATLAVVVFSVVPVLHRSERGLATRLRGEGRGASAGRARQRGRRTLVIAEFAVAVVLATGAGLLVRSFANVLRVDPGFSPAHLLSFQVAFPQYRYPTAAATMQGERELLAGLGDLPGVMHATAAVGLPTSSRWMTAMSPEGVAVAHVPLVNNDAVMPDYFQTLGIQMVQGRAFTASDAGADNPVAIVDEEFAKRYYPGASPIGRRIKWGAPDGGMPWVTIVGVASSVKARALDEKPVPATYFPALQLGADSSMVNAGLRDLTFALRTRGDPVGAIADARRVIASFDSQLSMMRPMAGESLVAQSEAARKFDTLLLSGFAALAFLLSAIGIYGLISYSVEERRREMGVRLAIGATPGSVIRLIVAEGARMAVVGGVAGTAGALLAMPVIRSLLFGVGAFDVVTLVAVLVLLIAVAALASWLPARRGSRMDPVSALRA
jgi:predicted permease